MSSKMKNSEHGKKETLMRAPVLRFPEFRSKQEWHENVISDLFNLKKKSEKVSDFDKEKVITVKLHTNGVIKNERNGTLTGGANYFIRHTGQFVFSKIDLLNGAFGLIPSELDGFCTSSDVPAFYFKKEESALFFINWLKANYRKIKIERTGTSSTLKRISVDRFLSMTIFLPDLQEQQKIADCLSSLDNIISLQTKKIDALQKYKKGLIQRLFPCEDETTLHLRFPEFRDKGEWEGRNLADFITERMSTSTNDEPLFSLTIENGITPKTERYERSFLVSDMNDAYKLMRPNDFAYNPMNLRFGAIGKYSGSVNIAISKYYNIFFCNKTVNSKFCEIYFKSDRMIAFYDSVAIGSLIEKRRVHFSDFLKFNMPFPQLAEQQKIADCLSSLDELITDEIQKLTTLKAHKTGLMQQLFPAMDEENG